MAKRKMAMADDRSIEGYGERKRDYGLIREDMSEQCNLPTRVIQGTWPMNDRYHLGAEIDDLFRGAEKQMGEDARGLKREKRPAKY